MTQHLEFHPHALLDKNNIVINVAVFDEWAHNHQLLEDVKIANNATKIVCCCQYGIAYLDGTWDGTKFWRLQPFPSWVKGETEWEAPVEYPTDGKVYIWSEDNLKWQEIE